MSSENTVNCHIKDGVNYSGFNILQEGGGTSGQVMSYAEWLQLTTEEQNNGEYFIPDFPTSALTPDGGFDTEPKLGSIKPVTSDGIARAMRVDTNPIGTVLALMGLTAPYGYLICDGTTHNIEDYPELADYFADQFGSVNKFGGNGTTTFAVPDLRGEFLRGTGTNSHTNQGSGAAVGAHQDATEMACTTANKSGGKYYGQFVGDNPYPVNYNLYDYRTYTNTAVEMRMAAEDTSIISDATYFSTRPTNTSVNFIIKAVNSPASAQQQLDMHNRYSTEETWTGKYWIDGKKIYRKTINYGALPNNTQKNVNHNINDLDHFVHVSGIAWGASNSTFPLPYVHATQPNWNVLLFVNDSVVRTETKENASGMLCYIFLEYTKTTD